MKVLVDYDDGTEPEEHEVTDGYFHFHPFEEGDEEKHSASVEVLEEDEVPEDEEIIEEEDGDEPEIPAGFDPGAHTISEVEEYVEDNPGERDNVRSLEEAGKGRVTLISWLDSFEPAP